MYNYTYIKCEKNILPNQFYVVIKNIFDLKKIIYKL